MKIIYEVNGEVKVTTPAPEVLWTQTEKDAEATAIAEREVEIVEARQTYGFAQASYHSASFEEDGDKVLAELFLAMNEAYAAIPAPIMPLQKLTIEEIAAKDVPELVEYEIVATDAAPDDRTFRAAWRKGSGRVDVDMPAARTIHMDRIRGRRDARLETLDQRQYGAEFDTERQTLRDIPANFDLTAATTPDELKALWPTELED